MAKHRIMDQLYRVMGLYRPFTFGQAARLFPTLSYEGLYQALQWEKERTQQSQICLLQIGNQYHYTGILPIGG